VPQVEFHSGVAEPLHFACRLLRKACRQGVAVAVTAPGQALAALDRELWTFEPLEFVPHLRLRPDQPADAALARTPVWLCEAEPPTPHPGVLVNLGMEPPEEGRGFDRIIEIVLPDADQRRRARQRWRAYEALGWPLRHHRGASA
jgi:DNA polymerase-3 subunit chi